MKRGGPTHPKMTDLAARLGIDRCHAVGIVESLWHFAAQYAKRGDVGKHTNASIAISIGFAGDADALVGALVGAGWLDECECHRLRVHDWADHADQGVSRSSEVVRSGFLPCYAPSSCSLDGDYAPPAVATAKATATATAGEGCGEGYVPKEQLDCPDCHAVAVVREKARYAKPGDILGWVCSKRRNGCGMEFDVGEPRLLEQLHPKQRDAVRRSVERSQAPPASGLADATPDLAPAWAWINERGGLETVRRLVVTSGLYSPQWCEREKAPPLTAAVIGHVKPAKATA